MYLKKLNSQISATFGSFNTIFRKIIKLKYLVEGLPNLKILLEKN